MLLEVDLVREKRVFGVTFTPNDTPERVEDYFGIHFREKPQKVVQTPVNRICSVASFIRNGDIKKAFKCLLRPADGQVVPQYGIWLRKPGHNDLMGDVHEVTHLMNEAINPTITVLDSNSMNTMLKLAKTIDYGREWERALTLRCVDEGVAIFAECAIGLMSADQENYNRALFIKNILLHGQPITLETRDEGPFNQSLWPHIISQELQDGAETIYGFFSGKIEIGDPFKAGSSLLCLLENQVKFPGFYFVYHYASHMAREYGIPNPSALLKLLQNPPVTFDELRDPQGFASAIDLFKEP